MVQDHLKEPFQLVLKEYLDVCPRGTHAHSFFEIIYVVSGSGRQRVNDLEMHYQKGDLFLIAPHDDHLFMIEQTTQFFFIRFNNIFIEEAKNDTRLLQNLEIMLQNSRNEPENILKNEADIIFAGHLMERIIAEHLNDNLFGKILIRQLVNTLLVLVAQNAGDHIPEKSEDKVLEMMQYIHANIYYPEKLKVEVIATALNISVHYLGRYFKRQTNETLQDYILSYKMKLIENRLLHSNLRMKEIAVEFGFADKSHMSRAFKKHKGTNPSDFKKHASRSAH